MSRILTAALFALTLSAPALADTVPKGATIWQHQPTGAGKPEAISCYQEVAPGSHIRNLQCAPNSYWAMANKYGTCSYAYPGGRGVACVNIPRQP
jgi:hypothetical protein